MRSGCAAQQSQLPSSRRQRVCIARAGSETKPSDSKPSQNSSTGSTEYEDEDGEEALEAKMNEFLRRQAMEESGEAYVAPASTGEVVLGKDAVTDQEAKQFCGQVRDMIKMLKSNRDMAFNEIKLTVMIEDPRARERRENLNIENDSGVSRDELSAALTEVAEGRIPKDRLALRELAREMAEWPYADLSNDSRLDQVKDDGAELGDGEINKGRRQKLIGRDRNEKPQGIQDLLPDWVGYGALYTVSSAPVIIGVVVVLVLFFNSVK